MSPDLRKQIWAEMQATGDRLRGVLSVDPRHPQGRNPHAHVAGCVKERFGCSYKDLPDERADEVRKYLVELEAAEREGSCGSGG
jgi:hypothetical protein